ncbi:hypothetical protein R1flu_024682 [Riccia fluitans]|uniref:RING-type domain-containing protein n=1 Tax=Riccia fluitans TaxID=41844 RepID=A0ABD1XVL1_9MARC
MNGSVISMEETDLSFVEDFGQKVDLTQRIREVLANYPEGTTILKELIQNADDAGATQVSFCLDRRQHGVESLIYGSLAEWQGPALLAYNNAQFAEEDFASISRIGDSKKRGQAWKTGRFGVGFNSVYHLSDLPSFVSGRYVVMFDPHCKFLPRISAANPGKRIDFVSSGVLQRHRDQFSPYCGFGCDMEHPYKGTLFRFPLRTVQQAAESRLSRQSYSEEDMSSLLYDVHSEAVAAMLFLKNIEGIQIYDWQFGAASPTRIYSTRVESVSAEIRWHRQAFSRLSMAQVSQNGSSSAPNQDVYSVDFVSEVFSGALKRSKRSESFLIAQCMGATTSRIGALAQNAARDYDLHLVPWASVAASISSDGSKTQSALNMEGRAFCFLPLPAKTGLPVHVNGYFELSSNRRDIWYGQDMDRGGKLRSDWNVSLLEDVVADCFARLMLEASRRLGPTSQYYSLWPTGNFSEPWLTLVKRLYARGLELPLLHTPAAGGKWITPAQALYHDEEFSDADNLATSLVAEGLPLVRVPDPLRVMLFEHCVTSPRVVLPRTVRDQLRRSGRQGKFTNRSCGLVLLEYCLGDVIDDEAAGVLQGLPLIPLADGGWGVFGRRGKGNVFVCSELERKIFQGIPDKIVSREIPEGILARLKSIAHLSNTNLCPVTDVFLLEMLPNLMPADWKNQDQVEWKPEGFARHPKQEWLSLLWEYLRGSCKDLSVMDEWPILPTASGLLLRPVAVSKLIRGGVWSSNMESLLRKLGCQFLRADLEVDHPQITHYVHEATGPGILDAISSAALNHLHLLAQMFESVPGPERRELREYLYNSKWYIGDQMKESHLRVFKSLPIFEAYNESGSEEMLFVDLGGPKRFLPPSDMDEFLLGPEFLCASSEREAEVLTRLLGIRRLGRAAFYKWRVLGRVSGLPSGLRDRMMLRVLQELPQLSAADSSIREMLKELAFVPNAAGSLRTPKTLYDPRNVELMTLLDDQDSFPAGDFAAPEVLEMLQGLGLRMTITPETVIQSARQTEALIGSDPQAACARGRALLAYLELSANKWVTPAEVDTSKSFGRIFMKVSTSFQLSEANGVSDAALSKFWAELATVCWCPVLMNPPHPHLPWPSVGQPVAPPKLVRLQSDMWLASASMRILDGECRSSVLSTKLGWASDLSGSVLAAQLLELGKNHLVVEDRALGQALAIAVPRIYTLLNNLLGTEEMEIVKAVLEGSRWVWVGDGFASVQEVAFSGPLHLAPYLRVIPADLAAFKELLVELGVRETLTSTEFALVLVNMAKDKGGAPIEGRQLSAAIWLVQHLADLHMQISTFVPDASAILTPASELVYNDAPWLSSSETSPIVGQTSMKGPRFVHSKISNDVAERLGVRSLRRLLLAENADSMDLGLHEAAEAFGQHEALTTRLKHIVEMYADGPGILCELVQNADDAGASEVSFLLDKAQYGTSSVLSPRMAEWQGAALYCLNNSVFTPRDLYAISRIGQDSKLEKPSAIGRFGLGFNSVYHFTDVPGFISGGNLVIFDPHACNLPGVTPSHPGLKISFVGRGLPEQFPDQFRPYLLFGCDLQKPFPGTLFRFPLRNSSTAASSEIKQEVYSPEDVMALFSSFQSNAAEALLFLRNVKSIAVYVREEVGQEMQELYRVSRQGSESKDRLDVAQKQVYEFVRGDPQNPIDKEQFYRKLQRTAESQLPWHCGKVKISLRMGGLEKSEFWLVSNSVGGGRAREQSVALENRLRGFVPWSGIAASLAAMPDSGQQQQRVESETSSGVEGVSDPGGETKLDGVVSIVSFEGRAFCFLPLPVKTGLPVHVNGYFELSSNRRDIWYGDDMSGGGKLRSDWNSFLLEDVAAPAYARLLAEAAKELGPSQRFYSLWPTHTIGEPWNSLLRRLYLAIVDLDLPVLHTAVGRGKWVSAKRAVFPDNKFSEAQELGKALAEAGLPLADASDAVVSKFREFCPSLRYLTPHLLRRSLAGRTRSLGSKRVLALALKYCLSDVEPLQEAEKLPGLGLLPLANGALGTFAKTGSGERILAVTGEEYELLQNAVPYLLLDRSIEDDVFSKVQDIAQRGLTNVSPLTAPILEELLPRLFPPEWRGKNAVVWTPGVKGQPTLAWMELLWKFFNASCADLSLFSEWPLLPTSDGQLLRITVRNSRVLRDDGWSENMAGVLQKASCYLLRNDMTLRHPTLGEYVHDATATGVLNALLAAAGGNLRAFGPLFRSASDGELREVRSFLCQSKWFAAGVMAGLQTQVFRALPVFESYGTLANGRRRFVDLPESRRWFAPDGIDEALLGESFIRAESLKEEEVLTKFLGVSKLSKSLFYQNFMFNNISHYSPEVRVRAMLNVIHELPRLVEEDPSILTKLSDIPFVSTEGGAVETPGRLYDPRVPELQTLLNKQAFFPSSEFAAVEVLDVLVQLGLRRSLGKKGLLDSARSVAMINSSDPEEAVKRGHALLAHLNDLEEHSESASDELDRLLVKNGASEDLSFDKMLGSSGITSDRGQTSRTVRHPLSENNDDDVSESSFWQQLINISWCPVYVHAPESGLPWPHHAQGAIAAPKVVRPRSMIWIVSATMRILDGECHSALLSNLGWSQRPDVSVLAAQLIELSKLFSSGGRNSLVKSKDSEEAEGGARTGYISVLNSQIPAIYKLLQEYVGSQDVMILQSMLEGIPWVWVGDGFVSPKELAFDSPAHFHPYLHIVPSEIVEYRDLLMTLGVRETFGAEDYAGVLQRIAQDVRGSPLSPDQLTFCLRVLEALAEILSAQGTSTSKYLLGMMLIPDASGVLVPAKDLVYNDAPWLAKSVSGMRRLVHPDIDNELADRLGAKSLRYLSLVDQEMTSNLPCLATNVISEILKGYGDEEVLLFDLLEIADGCKARKIHVIYDKREHPRQSLLQPNLGQFQGPALTVVFEGAVLTTEEVCNLQGYPPAKLRAQICDYGSGLLSVYSITDIPFIVSGGCLYLFDPSGQILAASLADGQVVTSGTPVGKAYSLTGTDLPQRFTDQFRPLQVSNTRSLGQRDATIIRMPLRTTPVSEEDPNALGDRQVAGILNKFKIHASSTMLFLSSVEDVCVSAWEEEDPEPHELFSVRIDPARVALRNPFHEKKWRKFQLTSLFGGFSVASKIHSLDVLLTEDGKKTVDKWLVVQTLGSGHTRDIALDRKYLSYNLTPIGGVAAHITRDGQLPPLPSENYVMTPLPLPVAFGLPVTIVGQFIVSHRAGHRHLFHRLPNSENQSTSLATPTSIPDDLAAAWNKELLACVRDSYVELLQELQRLRQDPSTSRADPPIGKGLVGTHGVPSNRAYAHWPRSKEVLPSVSRLKAGASYNAGIDWSCLTEWLIKPMYVRLAELPVWQLYGGTVAKASEGMFLAPPGIDRQGLAPPATVCDFLKAHYRVFVVPWELTKEMEAANVPVKELTPKMLRSLLKSPSVVAAIQSVDIHVDLLEYCCADVIFQEPSTPGADSSVGDPQNGGSINVADDQIVTTGAGSDSGPLTAGPGLRLRSGLEQLVLESRVLPGVLDRGGDAVGLVADIGRALADIGRGVIGDSAQQSGLLTKAQDLKGLHCPTGTRVMAKLGNVELLVGTREQQNLLPGMASKFIHSLCLDRPLLAELFRNTICQNALRLKPFSPELLAAHLNLVMPKTWGVRGNASSPSPWVAWEQGGQSNGPSSEWLQSFWENVDAASPDQLSLFTQWPLIPAVTSTPVLVRIGHRHLVFVPPVPVETHVSPSGSPRAENPSDTTADGDITTSPLTLACKRAFFEVERQHPWLLPLLRNCSVPVYDRRFLDCSVLQCCVTPEGQSLGQRVVSKFLALEQAGLLRVSELSLLPADCDSLFSLFASCTYDSTHSVSIPAYAVEERAMLRSLPIYKTARGGYVAIDQRLHCVVPPTAFMQPDGEHCLHYYTLAEGGSFYHELGISELTDHEVLARFALPRYETYDEREQERILSYVYSNWTTLQQEDTVVSALKQTKFVRTGNDSTQSDNAENNILCSPQELLDPENPLLKRVFAGDASRFPGGRFVTSGWLRILRDTGLRSATDAGLLLECAKKVEELGQQSSQGNGDDDLFEAEHSDGLGEVALEVWTVAGLLVENILANFASLYGTSFCEPLSKIGCIPAERGIQSGGTGRGKRVLASYGEAVLLKDWSLAWTCASVLARQSVVPPEFSWATLRLRSPPPFSVVLRHLKNVGKNGGEDVLARWPNGRGMKTVEDAFSEVLRYLSSAWDGLSDADKEALKGVHFIPVANGTRLAMASALYARISMDLAPFVFELPSAYLAYVKVLGELGMKEAPSVENMKHLLLQLRHSCGYQRLNPNELRAVLRILGFICGKSSQLNLSDQLALSDFASDAVVPDDEARLVYARSCVYVDAVGVNLVGEIDSARMKFVHPLVTEPLCIQLGVRKLSEVVVEELDESRSLEMTDVIGGVSRTSVAEKLRSPAFAESVREVVMEAGQTVPLLRQLSRESVKQILHSAADGLWFVRRLYTKFWLLPGRVDVTLRPPALDGAGNEGHRVYEFIDKRRILVAEPPDIVSITDLLPVVISRLLGSPSCLPLSALFKSPLGYEPAVKRVLRLGSSQVYESRQSHQQQSGVPGLSVIAPDAAMVQCHPLRPFHAGEIVAWRSDGDGETQPLRYGRVVEDVRAFAGQALYRLQVETGPGDIRFLLSSQVFSFKATAAATNGYVTQSEQVTPVVSQEITSNNQAVTIPPSDTRFSDTSSCKEESRPRCAQNVSAAEVSRAVKDMLAAAGMPMTLDQHMLLERSLALQEQLAAANTALSLEQEKAEAAQKEAEAARTAWTCRVCLTSEVDTMVVPCGHVLCHRCSSAVARCPFCRRLVSNALRIYRP